MWWSYYLLYAVATAVIGVASRRWYLYARSARRMRNLRTQVELNPANAVARAQLAEIWLDRRRPARAVPLLEQALERDPKSAELRYLLGLAHLRTGHPERALEPLSAALAADDKVRYGAGYLAIGDALAATDSLDDAKEAYRRYVKINTSSLEGYCKLAAVCERAKDHDAAKKWRQEALDTYRALPGFQRRKQLRWWLAARF
ncbi:MAG TPA: tetratricopeptide repeat protein [Kofleriaceae bacterium]|nr:tetratricopeptide repeat protein [Kofleriaceae bacterium]